MYKFLSCSLFIFYSFVSLGCLYASDDSSNNKEFTEPVHVRGSSKYELVVVNNEKKPYSAQINSGAGAIKPTDSINRLIYRPVFCNPSMMAAGLLYNINKVNLQPAGCIKPQQSEPISFLSSQDIGHLYINKLNREPNDLTKFHKPSRLGFIPGYGLDMPKGISGMANLERFNVKRSLYEVLKYALTTTSVTDLTIPIEEINYPIQQDLSSFLPHLTIEEEMDETIFVDEIVLEIIKAADVETLASLAQASKHMMGMVFESRFDIFKRSFNGTFKDEDKAHLKLMVFASKFPTYALYTYRSLSDYLGLDRKLKIDLCLLISSKVLPFQYLKKMEAYCKNKNSFYALSYRRVYSEATRICLLNQFLNAEQTVDKDELAMAASSLAGLSQILYERFARPSIYHTHFDRCIGDEHAREIAQLALEQIILIEKKFEGLNWRVKSLT